MSLIKPIQRSRTNPTATTIEGASHSFARRGAESAATRRLGAGSRRSAVGDAAALGATVAMAALVYYIVHKVRQQERALPPVGRSTVDDARGPGGHQIGTGISATNSNPNWVFAIAAEATEYSRQSFDNSCAFFEKLTRAQELDDVIEIQSEFATKTFGNFMTRASKVFELWSGNS